MGIPHLTRHITPFSEVVVLGEAPEYQHEDLAYITSIVIDGPSLVYHVFSRLLCLSNRNLEHPDVQPTCNEVSWGVAVYLLQLMLRGVKIEKICFDGALPLQKRETRLSRLERGRKKLENFRYMTKDGFRKQQSYQPSLAIHYGSLFSSRPLPTKLHDVPENPFIVPAVFEDLKTRWNKGNLLAAFGNTLRTADFTLSELPWADITIMVQGEADTHCAHVAKATDCAVLTNDSDLILHDIGAKGSVVLCSSVEVTHWDQMRPAKSQIRAMRLCPAVIAERLGIANVLSLAYEVKTHPDMGITELVQRVKTKRNGYENESDYRFFSEEYQCDMVDTLQKKTSPQCLDIRVAELFWQYAIPLIYTGTGDPHVYLPILTEDHSRRCAWVEGRWLRSIGYSVLNASHPKPQRYSYISEFLRRGGRIIVDKIPLGDDGRIEREMASLQAQLTFVQETSKQKLVSLTHWRIFALWYIFSEFSPNTAQDPGTVGPISMPQAKSRQLAQFLIQGRMGERLGWADIHLDAQVQSVLYSLRILHQLLAFLKPSNNGADQLKSTLDGLPSLHIIMMPIHKVIEEDIPSAHELVRLLFPLLAEGGCEETIDNQTPPDCQRRTSSYKRAGSKTSNGTCNPYELLALE